MPHSLLKTVDDDVYSGILLLFRGIPEEKMKS